MSFSVREVSAMLGLPASQIRSLATAGFLEPERGARGEMRFGFRDLVLLRTASELSSAHVPQRKLRRALERLREQLPAGSSLTGVRIAADGERVIVRDGDTVWSPESGQSLFDFSVEDMIRETAQFSIGTTSPGGSEKTAERWYELGCELEPADPERAIQAYRSAIALDPTHADAHVNLGRILHEQGAPAAAEKHYRAACEADPTHETAAFNLGVALEDLGRLSDAIDAYRRALAIDPSNVDAHYNVAGLYEKRGDKASALQHLKACRKR